MKGNRLLHHPQKQFLNITELLIAEENKENW